MALKIIDKAPLQELEGFFHDWFEQIEMNSLVDGHKYAMDAETAHRLNKKLTARFGHLFKCGVNLYAYFEA